MNSFHTYSFPYAKKVVVCGDIHGEFNAVIYSGTRSETIYRQITKQNSAKQPNNFPPNNQTKFRQITKLPCMFHFQFNGFFPVT